VLADKRQTQQKGKKQENQGEIKGKKKQDSHITPKKEVTSESSAEGRGAEKKIWKKGGQPFFSFVDANGVFTI